MSKVISTPNCSGCSQAVLPALILNCSLPMGEKIEFYGAHSGSEELKEMLKIDPSGNWELPHYILDRKVKRKNIIGEKEKVKGQRLSLSPNADIDDNYENLKAYFLR